MPLRTHTGGGGREGEATGVKGSFRIREGGKRDREREGGLFTVVR